MDDDKREQLGPGWGHLFLRDRRTPEERAEAEFNERARRRGSRKRWRDYHPAPEKDADPPSEG